MATRLVAAGVLLASGAVAWLAVTSVPIARGVQAVIGLSVLYVAYLAYRGFGFIRAALSDAPAGVAEPGPPERISVVVPARDEAPVIGWIVEDLAAQRYADAEGRPRFEVVVVDDGSGDGTGELAASAAQRAGARPGLVRVVRREAGTGPATKGSALLEAMPYLDGTLIAVVDADSRVAPDFLSGVARAWRRDPTAGALQVRREPLNADVNSLTGAQADELLMDLASQCGRRRLDGTAELRGNGMVVRRDVLEGVGGWSPTAITEDLEISTRLAAAGAHVALAPEVVIREEAVPRIGALWTQRLRWAEGSMRRLIDGGRRLLASNAPLSRKLDFLAFTGEFVLPPLFATSVVAAVVTIPLPARTNWTIPVTFAGAYALGIFFLQAAGLAAVGVRGVALVGRSLRGALFLLHWLVVIPAVLLRIALAPPSRTFTKTPRIGHRA